MSTDKKTIGLTPGARIVLEKLAQSGYFQDQMAAAKFAMSYAINAGLSGTVEGTDTTWNVGSFDSDGELRSIIPALCGETETPYRAVEQLMNLGLVAIGRRIEEARRIDLVDLMTITAMVENPPGPEYTNPVICDTD